MIGVVPFLFFCPKNRSSLLLYWYTESYRPPFNDFSSDLRGNWEVSLAERGKNVNFANSFRQ